MRFNEEAAKSFVWMGRIDSTDGTAIGWIEPVQIGTVERFRDLRSGTALRGGVGPSRVRTAAQELFALFVLDLQDQTALAARLGRSHRDHDFRSVLQRLDGAFSGPAVPQQL